MRFPRFAGDSCRMTPDPSVERSNDLTAVRPRSRRRRLGSPLLRRLLGVAIAIGAWQALSSTGVIDLHVLASPATAASTAWALKVGSLKRDLARVGVEDVQAVAFGNAPDLEAAMQGGSIDVGELSDTGAIVAKAAGVNTRLIAVDRIGLDAWLIARKNGPTSPAELRGRPVATLTGSYLDRYL